MQGRGASGSNVIHAYGTVSSLPAALTADPNAPCSPHLDSLAGSGGNQGAGTTRGVRHGKAGLPC